jgi:hypothetical protein
MAALKPYHSLLGDKMAIRLATRWIIALFAIPVALLLVLSGGTLAAQDKAETWEVEDITRGSATGQTGAKGYEHTNQYMHIKPVRIADNMEQVIQHPEQEKLAGEKLAALEKRFGKKPNVLIFITGDVGWLDPASISLCFCP